VGQAFAGIRRKFGLILDYEEGQERDESKFITYGKLRTFKGADITLTVSAPRDSTLAARRGFIESIIAGFKASGAGSFSLLSGSGDRMTVAPADPTLRILDTKIVLAPKPRTIDDTLDEVFKALEAKLGIKIVRGGLADGAMRFTVVTIGTDTTPIAARDLIAQTLDAMQYANFWILNWDPQLQCFTVLFQPAVLVDETFPGSEREVFIENRRR